jgi:hypothetical protein
LTYGKVCETVGLNSWVSCRSCIFQIGARGGAVGWGTALQAGRSRVRFQIMSLGFFIDTILPAALWPWCWLGL